MLALLLLAFSTHAEYRAFELVIANSSSGQERVVISTLNPREYRMYYPSRWEDQISYRATWMCKGNTSSHKPVCPKPEPNVNMKP